MSSSDAVVGIIGCGRIAGHHCRSIAGANGARLGAVCDLVPERAEAYGTEFGVPSYRSYHEMIHDHPEINTVAVITPSGMHREHALEVIAMYRKHVIVEKPTLLRPSHVDELYAAAESAGVRVFAVFQNRHNLAVRRVLSGIADGELGTVRSVAVRVRWCRPQRYYDLAPWRGTWAMDGGCLTNQGVHHVDLLRQFVGEIDQVCSVHRTLGATIEVEDTAVAVLKARSGAIGTLEITTAARPSDFEASISLVCENGLAQIGGIAVNELQVYSPDPSACATHSEDFSGNVYGAGHAQIYRDIVASLHGAQPYPVSREDAVATIRLLNAFYVSDERGGWVDVAAAGDSERLGRPDEALSVLYRTPPDAAILGGAADSAMPRKHSIMD